MLLHCHCDRLELENALQPFLKSQCDKWAKIHFDIAFLIWNGWTKMSINCRFQFCGKSNKQDWRLSSTFQIIDSHSPYSTWNPYTLLSFCNYTTFQFQSTHKHTHTKQETNTIQECSIKLPISEYFHLFWTEISSIGCAL